MHAWRYHPLPPNGYPTREGSRARRGRNHSRERIARLFAVEADIRGRSPAERREGRQRRSAPILTELKTFLDATLATISGKTSFANTICYATSHAERCRL
jgi:hypothetical protein